MFELMLFSDWLRPDVFAEAGLAVVELLLITVAGLAMWKLTSAETLS